MYPNPDPNHDPDPNPDPHPDTPHHYTIVRVIVFTNRNVLVKDLHVG